jgi:phosphoglycerate kinase
VKPITDLAVGGHVVLLRADLNVPLDARDGQQSAITDDGRIRASMPTITALAGRGARVLICAHLGRPKGDGYAARAAGGPSLQPVAGRLGELLGGPVPLAGDVVGPAAARLAGALADGEVGMLENVGTK